ncbi:MAG: hypothetical protein JNN15_20615 [Blastocatellia bacterium]|nr:hypothetical protein [Blastocatellia bacterium]
MAKKASSRTSVDVDLALNGNLGKVFSQKGIELTQVKALMNRGVTLDDLTRIATSSGKKGIEIVDSLTSIKGVSQQSAVKVAKLAQDLGKLDMIHGLVRSGNLENPASLGSFLQKVSNDIRNGRTGSLAQVEEAASRVANGRRVALEESFNPAGKADLIDNTSKEAMQMKVVTSKEASRVATSVKEAASQLAGKGGKAGQANELPPTGYTRVIDVWLQDASFSKLSRQQLLDLLRKEGVSASDLTNVDKIQIKTQSGTYTFVPGDFK